MTLTIVVVDVMQPETETNAETLPTFPPELEREIFERTARSYQGTGVILALVCRRVQLWCVSSSDLSGFKMM